MQNFNSHIGDQGELWFAAQLPFGWVWQPPRRDLGKDGLIVVADNSEIHNIEFSVQIKTTTDIVINNGMVQKTGISRSSIIYWFASPLPTLIVVVDTNNKRAWYAWHLDIFENPDDVFKSEQETFSIHIPKERLLDERGWDDIRLRLKKHFRSLIDAINSADMASKLLPITNTFARVASDLQKLASINIIQADYQVTDESIKAVVVEQIHHKY